MTEREIQTYAVKVLRKLGFTCCVTSNGRRTANTRGTPDVFVLIGKGYWIGLEFKSPTGLVSKEQYDINPHVARSIEEAVSTTMRAKDALRGAKLSD
jgi:hypothetical protein